MERDQKGERERESEGLGRLHAERTEGGSESVGAGRGSERARERGIQDSPGVIWEREVGLALCWAWLGASTATLQTLVALCVSSGGEAGARAGAGEQASEVLKGNEVPSGPWN